MKKAVVYLRDIKAGILTEDENGYLFEYDTDFLKSSNAEAISLTLPLSDKPYRDKVLFPFFDGLIPNAKKRKIRKDDFVKSMQMSGLGNKIIDNIFSKFFKIKDKWFEFIDISFLPDEMKNDYKTIIDNRLNTL